MKALDHLREVFFQDAAVIQDHFPNMMIFSLEVFKSMAWSDFKKRVLYEEGRVQSGEPQEQINENIPLQISFLFLHILIIMFIHQIAKFSSCISGFSFTLQQPFITSLPSWEQMWMLGAKNSVMGCKK